MELGNIVCILLVAVPILVQWISNWAFNVTESPLLDKLYFLSIYVISTIKEKIHHAP